jgi:hypothetical protein
MKKNLLTAQQKLDLEKDLNLLFPKIVTKHPVFSYHNREIINDPIPRRCFNSSHLTA